MSSTNLPVQPAGHQSSPDLPALVITLSNSRGRSGRAPTVSCKKTKVKGRNFQGKAKPEQGSTNMITVIEIGTSEIMLAPVDYKVRLVTKQFGFKNTIRCESNCYCAGLSLNSRLMLNSFFYSFLSLISLIPFICITFSFLLLHYHHVLSLLFLLLWFTPSDRETRLLLHIGDEAW